MSSSGHLLWEREETSTPRVPLTEIMQLLMLSILSSQLSCLLTCDISLSNQPCSCDPNILCLWCSSIANPSHPTYPSYIYIHLFSSLSLQSIPKVISLLRQYIIYTHMKISICAAALVACLVVLPVLVPARPVARTHPRMFYFLIISLLWFALLWKFLIFSLSLLIPIKRWGLLITGPGLAKASPSPVHLVTGLKIPAHISPWA